MPAHAVAEALAATMALVGRWPGPRDAVSERGVEVVRRRWVLIKARVAGWAASGSAPEARADERVTQKVATSGMSTTPVVPLYWASGSLGCERSTPSTMAPATSSTPPPMPTQNRGSSAIDVPALPALLALPPRASTTKPRGGRLRPGDPDLRRGLHEGRRHL